MGACAVTDLFHNLWLAALATATDTQVGKPIARGACPVVMNECFVSGQKYKWGR